MALIIAGCGGGSSANTKIPSVESVVSSIAEEPALPVEEEKPDTLPEELPPVLPPQVEPPKNIFEYDGTRCTLLNSHHVQCTGRLPWDYDVTLSPNYKAIDVVISANIVCMVSKLTTFSLRCRGNETQASGLFPPSYDLSPLKIVNYSVDTLGRLCIGLARYNLDSTGRVISQNPFGTRCGYFLDWHGYLQVE